MKARKSATLFSKIVDEIVSSPALFVKLWCLPPIVLNAFAYLLGSIWPVVYIIIGVILTLVIEFYLIVWYFNEPLIQKQHQDEDELFLHQINQDLKLNSQTDEVHFEDPRDLEPK